LLVSMNQEDVSGNPNMQLGGLLAPWPSDEGVQIVEEVLTHRLEDGRVFLDCWTSGGEWATVVLTPGNEDVLRLTLYPPGAPRTPRQTPCLLDPDPRAEPFVSVDGQESGLQIDVVERDGVIQVWFADLLVEITRKPWELVIKNRYGFQILREHRADANLRG